MATLGFESFLEQSKNAFVMILRTIFKNDPVLEKYKYNEDKAQTKIQIYPEYPYRVEFYPGLIVAAEGGDLSSRYLQDELVEEITEYSEEFHKQIPKTRIFNGRVDLTIAVTVLAESPQDRDKIGDRLCLILRHLGRDALRMYNIEYRTLRIGDSRTDVIEGRNVYSVTLTTECYMEYRVNFDISLVEAIEKIDIEMEMVNQV